MFRALFKAIFWLAEKILSVFALIAAFISVGWTGHLYERIVGGLISLYETAKGFILAYYHNEMFSEVWRQFTQEFEARLQMAGKNIETDPQTVLVAFLLTLVCFKLAAWVLKLARKGLGKRTPKIKKPKPRKEKSTAYEELYKPPEVSATTKSYLEKAQEKPPEKEREEEPIYLPPTIKPPEG